MIEEATGLTGVKIGAGLKLGVRIAKFPPMVCGFVKPLCRVHRIYESAPHKLIGCCCFLRMKLKNVTRQSDQQPAGRASHV